MPSPLSKLRSPSTASSRDPVIDQHDWGVDSSGRFLERVGYTKLCSQLPSEDKHYISPIQTQDLSPETLGDLIKAGLSELKGFQTLLFSNTLYFHARFRNRLTRGIDDLEVYISIPPGILSLRASTKDKLSGVGGRHRQRIAHLAAYLEPKIYAAAEKEVVVRRTTRINEWSNAIIQANKATGHFEPIEELDDPVAITLPETP